MVKQEVNITYPDGTQNFCGAIFTTLPDSRGKIEGSFRYSSEYLEHPFAFPLDPVNLPLKPKEFIAQRSEGVHGVFEDALPDEWGRKLLIKKAMLERGEQNVPNLLNVLGANGIGALSFRLTNGSKKFSAKEDSLLSIVDLEILLELALRYDAGLQIQENDLHFLAIHGSSPGGARPKGLIRKKEGSLWIAKFPRHNDLFNVESIEAATLELAELSGLIVPEFELLNVGKKKVLMVKRFDISENDGRYHMISFQTLLQADGYYFLNYDDLFEILKAHSFRPSTDLSFLFRQMVFNVAIGNTDDHLKNFCMLHKESGFCLSPAYDLLPDIYEKREHSLSFPIERSTLPPGKKLLQRMGKNYNLKNVDQIIGDVFQAVSGWKNVFLKYGVPGKDIHRLEWSINRRLNNLKK